MHFWQKAGMILVYNSVWFRELLDKLSPLMIPADWLGLSRMSKLQSTASSIVNFDKMKIWSSFKALSMIMNGKETCLRLHPIALLHGKIAS